MNFFPLLVCGALGLVVTLVLIPIIRRHAGCVSTGSGGRTFHHTHKTPVSRLGGVALAAAFVLVQIVAFIWFRADGAPLEVPLVIAVSSLAMFALGLADDLRPLGARKKLMAQILVAMAVCYFGIKIEKFQNPFTGEVFDLGLWGCLITVIWLVALTNLINLIDGVDGLAGGIALMVMGLLMVVGGGGGSTLPILCAAGMFGALLGFLRYNFPPAKIYMGDGGAYLLGFLIGILTLVHSQKGTIIASLIAPLFVLALPIVDVSIAILRRGLKGLPIFRADRKHLHHKLQEMGFSRTRTVLILYGLSSVFLLMAFGIFWSQGKWLPILFGFVCLILLLSARSFNFSRDWFAVGRVLENSLELRKETHYALAMARWLEIEAERSASVEELWGDYAFMVRKLGLTSVQLTLDDGERLWQGAPPPAQKVRLQKKHDLGGAELMQLEFTASEGAMSKRLFDHFCELAAEAWLKAANRWGAVNGKPVCFQSRVENPPAALPLRESSSLKNVVEPTATSRPQ